MKGKTLQYVVVIAILLVANLGLVFTDGLQSSSSFDDKLFLIENIGQVNSVMISHQDKKIELAKDQSAWKLNNDFDADENFVQILLSLLNQVRVKRAVGTLAEESFGNIEVRFEDGTLLTFDFASDPLGTKSYFVKDKIAYQVEVPGYRDNVVNILQLTEDQWRNRIVFDGSWRTIQKLTLASGGNELMITFRDQFFEVDGIAEIDSTGVVDYLNQFQLFQANEMVSEGRFPEMDSLRSSAPLAILSIDDIQSSEPIVFRIYPSLAGQAYHLVIKNDDIMMVFDQRRIQSLLKFNEDFKVVSTP